MGEGKLTDIADRKVQFGDLKAELLIETSGREAAHRRILVLRTYSKLAINLTSFFIICTSIIALVFADRLTVTGITVLGCATIFATIYSMIVDNLENSKNYSEKSFRMEKSAAAMRCLYDEINHMEAPKNDSELRRIVDEKNSIVSRYGLIDSITDSEYAQWLNREKLDGLDIPHPDISNADKKYRNSRFSVFWVYLIFPIILLIGSFYFVINFAINSV
ncbi:MAG: SLATT domain-containing protein [Rhodobacter sp.]|nr:SLATT domain-containing protein [Rhodobacter sp.]